MNDPLEQVAHGQPDALHALIGAVEAKDPYTHGHSARVAELSTRIGLLLALEPEVDPRRCTRARSCTTWGRSASPTRS